MASDARYEVARFRDLSPEPWRNGRGVTRHVTASGPVPGAPANWRLSLAEISGGAPFSRFPGFDRWLLVAQGRDVALEVEGERRDLSFGDVTSFAGEAQARALRSRPATCQVLNLMTRRGSARGTVRRSDLEGRVTFSSSEHSAVVVLDGSLEVGGEPVLGALDTLVIGSGTVTAETPGASLAIVHVGASE